MTAISVMPQSFDRITLVIMTVIGMLVSEGANDDGCLEVIIAVGVVIAVILLWYCYIYHYLMVIIVSILNVIIIAIVAKMIVTTVVKMLVVQQNNRSGSIAIIVILQRWPLFGLWGLSMRVSGIFLRTDQLALISIEFLQNGVWSIEHYA